MAPQDLITITLRPMAGNLININIEPNATVLRIKQLFFEKEGIPTECTKLYFNNLELENYTILNTIGIVNNSSIHYKLNLQASYLFQQLIQPSNNRFVAPQQ